MEICEQHAIQTVEDGSMLTTNKYIKQWKQWINRDKKYTPDELEELETFLLDKIEDLQTTQKLSDKEAFLQALDIMGEQGMLTEEFSKVRRSKFDKVKLWAFLQTFVCIVLVVIIAAPYIHIPRKNPSDFLIGDKVGTINGWAKEQGNYWFQNVVSNPKNIYYYSDGGIFHFENTDRFDNDYQFTGSYFSTEPVFLQTYNFDFDQSMNLYSINSRQIQIYQNSQLKESISLPEKEITDIVIGVKVVNEYLFVFITVPHDVPVEGFTGVFTMNYAISSHYFICDLTLKEKKFEKVTFKTPISAVDRSEDEIAFLTMNGEIEVYTVVNKRLILNRKWKIINFSKFFPNQTFPPLVYTKNGNQMVIKKHGKGKSNEYYYLNIVNKDELKTVPLENQNIVGILKMSLYRGERLLMIRTDDQNSKLGYYCNLYAFKE